MMEVATSVTIGRHRYDIHKLKNGVQAVIVMKGKGGASRGGFEHDAIILRGILKEEEKDFIRGVAKKVDSSFKWKKLAIK